MLMSPSLKWSEVKSLSRVRLFATLWSPSLAAAKASPIRKTKNLCYTATFWEAKKLLITNLLNS